MISGESDSEEVQGGDCQDGLFEAGRKAVFRKCLESLTASVRSKVFEYK